MISFTKVFGENPFDYINVSELVEKEFGMYPTKEKIEIELLLRKAINGEISEAELKKQNPEVYKVYKEYKDLVKHYIDELKDIFFDEAEKKVWYENGVPYVDLGEVIRGVVEHLEGSKFYSILKERKENLLKLFDVIDESILSQWQEEFYDELEKKKR